MLCPICMVETPGAGPYRQAQHREDRRILEAATHASGVSYEVCPSCGGAFFAEGVLRAVEDWARAQAGERGDAVAGVLQRAYARGRQGERAPRACPACGEELFEREWRFGTMLMVDVCIGCRGVWLDAGELEALEAL